MRTMADILSTIGVILSTVGNTQYPGGLHDAGGGPAVLNTPHGTHDIPHMYQ